MKWIQWNFCFTKFILLMKFSAETLRWKPLTCKLVSALQIMYSIQRIVFLFCEYKACRLISGNCDATRIYFSRLFEEKITCLFPHFHSKVETKIFYISKWTFQFHVNIMVKFFSYSVYKSAVFFYEQCMFYKKTMFCKKNYILFLKLRI